MRYTADRFRNTKAGISLDVEAIKAYDDLVDLSIGDTDFITDSRIIDAAFEDARAGYTRYGFPKGDPELIEAIRSAWKEDYGQELDAEEICVTASSCLGMAMVMLAILNPGDEVLVFSPYFGVYRQQIELAGGVCVEVPTFEAEGYRLDEARIEAAITPKTRAMIFNNPSNPTGAAYERGDLELLVRVAEKHDLLVAADEIYTRYFYEGDFIPLRTLPGMEKRTITLNSFSKNYMMTGWRVGFIIAPAQVLTAIQYLNGGLIYTAPSISQRAALHALPLRKQIQQQYISEYRERVYYASKRIEAIQYMSLMKPRGTFYLFPGIEKTGLTSREFCDEALHQAHVLLTPGSAFGNAGEGHVRIAVTAPLEKIALAMDRLEKMSF